MTQLTFDTLEFVKTLEKAGIPKEHAEAITTAQKQAFTEMASARDLATKRDITLLRQDMLELEKRMAENNAAMKTDLIKWFMGTILTILGFMLAGFGMLLSRLP